MKKNFYIFPLDYVKKKNNYLPKVGVVIYLYYIEDIERYTNYIKEIPMHIRVLIISSREDICSYFEFYHEEYPNVSCVRKENRGRDISALLVTARDFFFENEYIAFLHDKKHKVSHTEKDIYYWTKAMWDNTVISNQYINNVINMFEEHKEIGLALPVLNIGNTGLLGYLSPDVGWGKNYDITTYLIDELGIHCSISRNIPPVSYGTVFWCRTKAMLKLYSKKWSLEDFPEEPLPDDGTISHAIERILPYVAEDAGYSTCMIMNDSFASSYLSRMDRMIGSMWNTMNEEKGIIYPYQLIHEEAAYRRLKDFCDNYEVIYIYGAGKVGKSCFKYMREVLEVYPIAFIDINKEGKKLFDLPIISLDDVKEVDNVGIILSVGASLLDEVISTFIRRGIDNYITFFPDV